MRVPLAVAGDAPLASVDEFGYLHFGEWRVEWWVGGEDHWHVPAASASRRQRVLGNTAVIETVIRVPGGDVAWQVAAAASPDGGAVVAEFHNTAALPVALGVALVAPDEVVHPMRRPSIHFTAPARATAAHRGVDVFVHPVSHGSTWRCSVGATHPDALPPIEAIVRGWQTFARQGASIATGDDATDDLLAVARTSLLLHTGGLASAGRRAQRAQAAAVATALTLLGHEDESEALRLAARLRPKRGGMPTVADIDPARSADPLVVLADAAAAAATVTAIRAELVDDAERRTVKLLPGATLDTWRGRSVDVSDLPTNSGPISFALRWHGDKPALLWQTPETKRRARITLRAPALDPDWSTKEPAGEELLNPRA